MVRNYPAVVLQYSFIHFESRFSSGEDVGGNTTRTNRNTSRFSATSDGSAGSTPRRDQAKVGDVIKSPGPWSTSLSLSRVCSQQDLPHRSCLGYSVHMVKQS